MTPLRLRSSTILLAGLALFFLSAGDLGALQSLEARVWIDRGDEPILQRGERVRIYYRTNQDAYVAIFQIDADGETRLLYPRTPDEIHHVRGDRDHRLLFPRSPYWRVDDQPGVGYFFIIASPEPMNLSGFRYSRREGGWDLTPVGALTHRDPYEAIDDFVDFIVPDWEYVDYALDFATYHVGQRHEYPRFMCYQCHGYQPYSSWNPYLEVCASFRVVIYDDPYFYPSQRYRGDRVVYVRPEPNRPRYVFKERARGEVGTPTVRPRAEADRRDIPRRRVDSDRRTADGSRLRRQAPDRTLSASSRRNLSTLVTRTRSSPVRPVANPGRRFGGGPSTRSPNRPTARSSTANRRVVPNGHSTSRSVQPLRPTRQRTPVRLTGGSSARPTRSTPRSSAGSVRRSAPRRVSVRSAPTRSAPRTTVRRSGRSSRSRVRRSGGGGAGPPG